MKYEISLFCVIQSISLSMEYDKDFCGGKVVNTLTEFK